MNTAAKYLASKQVVTTTLSSTEIEEHVPRALKENAMFSARTIYAEHLSETQRDIQDVLSGKIGPAEVRTRMGLRLDKLSYQPAPEDTGTLKDLSSDLRTNLIINHQTQNARGYASWRGEQNDAVMTVWPAQELYRAEFRVKPREWRNRWNSARRDLGEHGTSATYAESDNGPFVAQKNDRIWTHPEVNRFGNPWTPFDYRSGMRLRQVMASRARELGVIKDGEKPDVRRDPMEYVQVSSASGVPQPILDEWIKPYGRRARIIDGKVAVTPHPDIVKAIVDAGRDPSTKAAAIFGYVPESQITAISELLDISVNSKAVFRIDADDVRHIHRQHGEPHEIETKNGKGEKSIIPAGELNSKQTPLTFESIAAVPVELEKSGAWKLPQNPEKTKNPLGQGVVYENEDGMNIFCRIQDGVKTPKLHVVTMYKKKKAD